MTAAVLPSRTPRLAWIVWGAAAFAYLVSITQRTTLGVAGLQATDRFHASASILATFSVVQLLVYAGLQVPVGALTDRLGSRRMIATGAVLMAGGQAVLAFATSTPMGFVGRVLVGAGDAMTFISVLRLLPTWFPPRLNPLLSQVTAGIGQLGQIVSLVPFAALLGLRGWTQTFLSMSALSVLAFLLAAIVVRNAPRRGADVGNVGAAGVGGAGATAATQPSGAGATADEGQGLPIAAPSTTPDVARPAAAPTVVPPGAKRLTLPRAVGLAWRRPGTRLGFWTHWISAFSVNVFLLGWGYPFLVSGEQLEPATASVLMALFVVVSIFLGPVVGIAVARYPLRRTNLALVVVGAGVLAWATVIAWPGPAPLWLLAVLCLFVAAGGPASMIAFDFARTENPPALIGAATGLSNVGSFSGGLLAIWGVGYVLDIVRRVSGHELYSLTGFRFAFLVVLAVYAVGLIGFAVERRRTRAARLRAGGRPIRPLHHALVARLRPGQGNGPGSGPGARRRREG